MAAERYRAIGQVAHAALLRLTHTAARAYIAPMQRSTEVLPVDPGSPDPAIVRRAADTLARGGLVAFPTETVYGLGANALDEIAVRGIFAAKGRPAYNPLIVHVANAAAARALVAAWPAAATRAAEAFWPGPLTLVLPKRATVPDVVTAGLPSVAVRVPAHPVALALLRAAGCPAAAPSANRSTGVSPTTAAHVLRTLNGRIDLVLDGGPTPVGIESTVLDLTGTPRVLRPGSIGVLELEAVLGPIAETEPAHAPAVTAMPSPGMLARHYSPDATLRIVNGSSAMRAELVHAAESGLRAGVIAIGRLQPSAAAAPAIELPADAAGYARGLYAALHTLDADCDIIFVQAPPQTPEWAGIRDRLRRAAER